MQFLFGLFTGGLITIIFMSLFIAGKDEEER